jgi:hypothetical protein
LSRTRRAGRGRHGDPSQLLVGRSGVNDPSWLGRPVWAMSNPKDPPETTNGPSGTNAVMESTITGGVIVSGTSKHLRKPALLVVLVAIVGLGAAGAMALTASSAPKPFELVFNRGYDFDDDGVLHGTGTFTSKAPFCESGSAVDVWSDVSFGGRFGCADGSGSITLRIGNPDGESGDSDWGILEGTGQYAGLRGRGKVRGEDWTELFSTFRSTFQGVVAADAVAPTISVASAQASKVKGTKSIYTIPVALDISDDVADNPVTYKVIVTRESGAGPWLASKSGEAIGGISFELRVRRPNGRVRPLLIRTTAVDPVGNESSLDARVKLPK